MSFQAYLKNIQEKTGKSAKDFRELAAARGFDEKTKAGDIVMWLKQDFDLGHGHAMAIYALLSGKKNEDSA